MPESFTVATICARGGSKGVPGKNIRPVLGRPLISYTIQQALEHKEIDRVFVSTDSPQIADVARDFGAEVPFLRPQELATDSAPKIPKALKRNLRNIIIKKKKVPLIPAKILQRKGSNFVLLK